MAMMSQDPNQNSKALAKDDSSIETVLFAAGCFWGVEEAFRTLPGVLKTTVGYSGGASSDPTYREVCAGTTGHAEVVEIRFDPSMISFRQLLDVFWASHDPTQLNRQGPDVGSQYRSAIFYSSNEQAELARQTKAALSTSSRYNRPIVTEISLASTFWPAEEYHQQYLVKHGMVACPSKIDS